MNSLERGDVINALLSSAYSGRLSRRELLRVLTCLGLSHLVSAPLAAHAEAAARVQEGNRDRLLRSYDYVIVGGGSAGCLLANRLSRQTAARVLLVEAGENDLALPAVADPREWFSNFGSERLWKTQSIAQDNLHQRQVGMPFGRTLGGSGSVNAMIWLLGDPRDYAVWARYGGEEWGYEHCRTVFRSLEHYRGDRSADRGDGGPFPVTRTAAEHPLTMAYQEAGKELGLGEVLPNGGGAVDGTGILDFNIVDGRRMGPAQVLLQPVLDRANLTVLTGAQVQRLVVEHQQARAVEVSWNGEIRRIGVDTEVVLTAGALGSPKLLQCSGIGPSKVLRAAGVDVSVDLPGVGRGLHDHPLSPGFLFATKAPLAPYQASGYSTVVFHRTNSVDEAPNIHLLTCHFGSGYADGQQDRAYRVLVAVGKPTSRGSFAIRSPSMADRANIDPRYLDTQRDRDAFVEGLKLAHALGNSKALASVRSRLLQPTAVRSEAEMLDFARKTCATYHHYVGTCRFGADEEAVVSPSLKVRGVDNLRVADASVIPEIPCANTHVAALVVAERAAREMEKRG